MTEKRVQVLFWLLLALNAGCIQHASPDPAQPDDESSAVDDSGDSMGIGFYPSANDDPALPSANGEIAGNLGDALVAGDVIDLQNRIPLPGAAGGRLFLAFPEQQGAKTVEDASYEHRVEDASNDLRDEADRHLVSHDAEGHRWFIPMDELFVPGKNDPSPLDEQILTLHLRFSDDSQKDREIRFRVNPRLPAKEAVLLSSQAGSTLAGAASEVQQADQNGWEFATERYRNPTSRPLTVWFRLNRSDLQLNTEFGMHLLWEKAIPGGGRPSGEPDFEPDENRVAKASLRTMALRVVRGASQTSLSLPIGTWKSVALRAGEEIQVQWLASPTSDQKSCPSTSPTHRTIWVCMGESPFFRRVPCDVSATGGPNEIPAEWRAIAYQVSGAFSREVVLSEAGVSADEVFQSRMGEALLGREPVQMQTPPSSSDLSGLPDYLCQGAL